MDWFKTVKRFYPKYWTASMVGDAVIAKKITEEEYKEIVGVEYPNIPEETQ
ncbi:XkdX family protein [Sporosarcina trichiuri]|uniref:XkdX family protein n=1 Tax=Sporosarcina trichiuri TaxID=3056445 RepID=UPI0025B2A6E8|nr:XkdX family protein [Sporosarcina sp. 0.2-SM1T-5]WJY27493.1 XkdX family protein [Sporosarcina sp. 0.2-SM1T-5]